MVFTVREPDGLEIDCPTADDAVDMVRRLRAARGPLAVHRPPVRSPLTVRESLNRAMVHKIRNQLVHGRPVRVPDGHLPAARMIAEDNQPRATATDQTAGSAWQALVSTDFYGDLNELQRAVLEAVALDYPIDSDQLTERLQLRHTRDLTVIMQSLSKAAAKHGLDWRDIVRFKIKGARSERRAIYEPGSLITGEPSEAAGEAETPEVPEVD